MDHRALLLALPTCMLAASLGGCLFDDEDLPPPDIAEALAAMDEVISFEEMPASSSSYRRFEIQLAQPVDHGDPDSPVFSQHLTLLHRSYDDPMVLATTGYHNYLRGSRTEPTRLLQANQIVVEHRYFGSSRPEPVDWSHLTIEQAAADHHHIVEVLAPLYQGPWISTGASKGGMTSVFHRRFYPDDVDATIAYVAPISYDVDDVRYEAFLGQVGYDECRQQVRELQREALRRREAMELLASDFAGMSNFSFERMGGISRALEAGIVEFEWAFWQYRGLGDCDDIPDNTADDQSVFAFLNSLSTVENLSDQSIATYEPYYYQSFTQLGYPSVPTEHLADLLQFDYEDEVGALVPEGAMVTYDPMSMQDISAWVASQGERLLFIYGENDPWTGGAFELGSARDSYLFVAPEENHGAKIADLVPGDADLAMEALRAWTGIEPAPASLAPRRIRPLDREGLLFPPPVIH